MVTEMAPQGKTTKITLKKKKKTRDRKFPIKMKEIRLPGCMLDFIPYTRYHRLYSQEV